MFSLFFALYQSDCAVRFCVQYASDDKVTDVHERIRHLAVFIIIIYKKHIHPFYVQP